MIEFRCQKNQKKASLVLANFTRAVLEMKLIYPLYWDQLFMKFNFIRKTKTRTLFALVAQQILTFFA
jgi:hypothetical protein